MHKIYSYDEIIANLTSSLRERAEDTSGRETNQTIGVLFARPVDKPANKEILENIHYFDERSAKYIDFMLVGYGVKHNGEPADAQPVGAARMSPCLFSAREFDKVRKEFAKQSGWQYSGACDLVLVQGVLTEGEEKAELDFAMMEQFQLDDLLQAGLIPDIQQFVELIIRLAESLNGNKLFAAICAELEPDNVGRCGRFYDERKPRRTWKTHRASPPRVGILTIRPDEYDGVRAQLATPTTKWYGANQYLVSEEQTCQGKAVEVAVAKLVGNQGDVEAQRITSQMMDDFQPDWIVVSGIGGAIPDDNFSLFDVVVSTEIYDFTVQEVRPNGVRRFSLTGGNNLHKQARTVMQHLSHCVCSMGDIWSTLDPRPSIDLNVIDARLVHVDQEHASWNARIKSSLEKNFRVTRVPKVYPGAIASASTLVKDADLAIDLLRAAKRICVIDMEIAGVLAATRDVIPCVAVRGISDIVGLARAEGYNDYAASAAGNVTVRLTKAGFFSST